MEIVKSDKYSADHATVIDDVFNSIFEAYGTALADFKPAVKLVVSPYASDNPDVQFDVNNFFAKEVAYQMLDFRILSEEIIGETVDPRTSYTIFKSKIEGISTVTADAPYVAPPIVPDPVVAEPVVPTPPPIPTSWS